ncbi:hypothetical protein RJ639_033776 [Escallonia herrerae]|uniref:Phytocyanin domain-containing protein n=1 Tax=Escallonia herrerae TaxID=1293975 RepID=A0AA88WY34_9ASTE|nr:hypothetical protein RJ639_033776 [Escallonia herrerae]
MESKYMSLVSFVSGVLMMGFLFSSQAYVFHVGGRKGWVLKPSEDYNHWAERNRFQVNDTLVFKYKAGSDSVLIVNKDEYNKCNKANPLLSFNDGESEFKLDRSGLHFFISGQADNCEKGQKLIVLVMAPRNTTHKAPKTPVPVVTPPPSPSPSTAAASSPAVSPPPQAAEVPEAGSPGNGAPEPGERATVFEAPAPAPSGAAAGSDASVGLLVGLGIGMSMLLGGFGGLV